MPERHAQFGRASELRLALDMQRNRIALTLPDLVWPDHLQALPEIRLQTPAYRMAH